MSEHYFKPNSSVAVTTALRHDAHVAVLWAERGLFIERTIWNYSCHPLSLGRFHVIMSGLWAVSSMVEQ